MGEKGATENKEPMVSALILTYNNLHTIRKSLDSIANLVNEIVVVDGGSDDGTIEVLRAYGAFISGRKFHGFDEERNVGLQLVHGEWVLSLDSDEVVPRALESELRAFIDDGHYDAIYVPRRNYLAGRIMKSCYPDWQIKLFRRGCLRFVGNVHEQPKFDRPVKRAFTRNSLIHYSDMTLGERFAKEVRYSRLAIFSGKRSILKHCRYLPFTLVYYPLLLLLRKRFIEDGMHGMTIALISLAAYMVALNQAIRSHQRILA